MSIKKINIKTIPSPKTVIWGEGKENKKEIPKIIWFFWDSPTYSPTVALCINRLKELNPGFEINIIDFKTINNFLPDFNRNNLKNLHIVNITDLIRLELVYRYGGIYLDASVFLIDNLDWVIETQKKNSCDFIGFYTERYMSNADFPMVESWFFAASPENKFMKEWLQEYKNIIFHKTPDYLYEDIDTDVYSKLPDPGYLKIYVSAAIVMRKSSDYILNLIKSEDGAHFYNVNYLHTKPSVMQNVMLLSKIPDKLPQLIKLTNAGRLACDMYIEKGLYKFDSILFKLSREDFPNKHLLRLKRLMRFSLKYLSKKK
ncbi:glycosyltransferase family 32 protein [Epilithonimonas sp. UC225_85]|uniref:glycosyltransferase family 32 protein n=1 Tax=Epilithonimonas sp. UC225_85 TaxID=3350167 RepID=UPI0036D2AB34